LLDSRVLELTNKDLLETEEQGAVEEEVTTETFPSLSLPLKKMAAFEGISDENVSDE
jgi:hypothetical protein